MRRISPNTYVMTWVIIGALIVSPLQAAGPEAKTPTGETSRVVDIALDANGNLHGRLVDPTGKPIESAELSVLQGRRQLHQVAVDKKGLFVAPVGQGGTYHLLCDGEVSTVRAWTKSGAPPRCPRQLLIVRGSLARGQEGSLPFTRLNPWVVAGVVAIAVAIPVALHNNRDNRDGS